MKRLKFPSVFLCFGLKRWKCFRFFKSFYLNCTRVSSQTKRFRAPRKCSRCTVGGGGRSHKVQEVWWHVKTTPPSQQTTPGQANKNKFEQKWKEVTWAGIFLCLPSVTIFCFCVKLLISCFCVKVSVESVEQMSTNVCFCQFVKILKLKTNEWIS